MRVYVTIALLLLVTTPAGAAGIYDPLSGQGSLAVRELGVCGIPEVAQLCDRWSRLYSCRRHADARSNSRDQSVINRLYEECQAEIAEDDRARWWQPVWTAIVVIGGLLGALAFIGWRTARIKA